MISFIQADATALPLPDRSVDLVVGSPPYTDARTYGIGSQRGCREWVEWMLPVVAESLRVSKGLVVFVVGGVTRDKCYLPACEGLLWEWWSRGGECFRPVIWHKVDPVTGGGCAIPGSGGKQWFRNDWEYCMAFKRPGDLLWADNTACGHKPLCRVGGEMSNRNPEGRRINATLSKTGFQRRNIPPEGGRGDGIESGRLPVNRSAPSGGFKHFREAKDGTVKGGHARDICKIANPGDVLRARVGGGHLGHELAHEGEAPYPVGVPERFVKSFAPVGGLVLDPFGGSGTTAHACKLWGRSCISSDLRWSQAELSRRRLATVEQATPQMELFA